MPIKQISPEEAKALLDSDEGYIYLDVRSEMEFQQGHPENAYNIPIQNFDMAVQMLTNNPEFLQVVENNFSMDAKLLVGCASGPRSQSACESMQQKDYENLANVDGGFSGKRDISGNVIKAGWSDLEFPVSSGDGGERSYPSLRNKAKNAD